MRVWVADANVLRYLARVILSRTGLRLVEAGA
jgi:hypothetical protein